MHFLLFPLPINYNHTYRCKKFSTHSLPIWFWLKISFPFLEIMVLRMTTSYGLQVAQVNEKSASKSSLDLTLTQHSHDENPEPWKVWAHLEVDPPWPWYYYIYLKFCTLVILLQINTASRDELETVCEGCYEIEYTSIFAWYSIPSIGHYRWLCGSIRWLPFNSKVNYLVRTIWRILDFLQLWIIIVA